MHRNFVKHHPEELHVTTQMSESVGSMLNRLYLTSSQVQSLSNVRLSPCPNAAAHCPENSVSMGFSCLVVFSLSLYQALEKVGKLEAENESVEQVGISYT